LRTIDFGMVMRARRTGLAALYVIVSVGLSLGGLFAGLLLMRYFA
jgi:hypothetical protein